MLRTLFIRELPSRRRLVGWHNELTDNEASAAFNALITVGLLARCSLSN